MLIKLALTGMKSKTRDYLVLLSGLVMAISIFYMFQTMARNRDFIRANAVINSIELVYLIGSVLLAAITFFYMMYASGFLLSLRQREFGLYLALGARKSKIRSLMVIETLVLGAVALAAGLILGFGLSALVARLMSHQLQMTLVGYHAVYGPAAGFTVLFFAVLFGLSAMWNQLKLARLQVLQLVHGHAQADRVWVGAWWKRVLGIVGVIALGMGYLALIGMEQLREIGLVTAAVMTPLGTYLLFVVLLPPFAARMKKRNRHRGIRAFTFGQLSFRINGLTKLLATAAMLIALGTGAIAGGMAFVNDAGIKAERYSVYDAVVHNPSPEEDALLASVPFTDRLAYRYKIKDETLYFAREDLDSRRPLIRPDQDSASGGTLVRITDELPAAEAADSAEWISDAWPSFLYGLAPNEPIQATQLVNDEAFRQISAREQVVVLGKTRDFQDYRPYWETLDRLEAEKYKEHYVPLSKYAVYRQALGDASGTFFMGFFLGIAFLAMMASVLMFKVLTGAAKDIQRYEMLSKLGVRRERLSRSICHELFYIFLFPGIAGLLHVVIGINLFAFIIREPYYRLWVPLLLFAAIYFLYYLLTVRLYRHIVLNSPRDSRAG